MERDDRLDFLRFIGISLIVLAHIDGTPKWLWNVRNFDVPLLVIVSAVSYAKFSSMHYRTFFTYFKKRFLRLVVPTWCFLTIFNIFKFSISPDRFHSFIENILFPYMLIGGTEVGVWVIRVFVIISIVAPFAWSFIDKIRRNSIFYIIVCVCYLLYIALYFVVKDDLNNQFLFFLNILILHPFGYVLLFTYGLRLTFLSKKETFFNMVFFLIICCCLTIFDKDCSISDLYSYKYPARGIYFFYGLFCSVSLYFFVSYYGYFQKLTKNFLVSFVGSNTIWIYLWHFFAQGVLLSFEKVISFNVNFFGKFLFVYLFSIIVVLIQVGLVELVGKKTNFSFKKYHIFKTIFTG